MGKDGYGDRARFDGVGEENMMGHREIVQQVIKRDGGVCVACGELGDHVHHIVPRSHADKKHEPEWLWAEKNLCLLNWDCHEKLHTRAGRVYLLNLLKGRFGYDYSEEPFRQYC